MKADDPRHGTNAGYVEHIATKTPSCQPCRDAHAAYKRGLRTRRYLARVDKLTRDATGAHRRIRALQAIGWTFAEINDAAGKPGNHFGGFSGNVLRYRRIGPGTFAAIEQAYRALSMTVPQGPYRDRNRSIAKRRGYVPPLAWDDIDDPAETPKGLARPRGEKFGNNHLDPVVVERVLAGEVLDTTRAEKAEIVRRWVASGRSELSLCKRLGWKPGRYVERQAS